MVYRLKRQREQIAAQPLLGKINGAVGNFNAHLSAYPTWAGKAWPPALSKVWAWPGTRTPSRSRPHDYMAELFQAMSRVNTILIDLDRDVGAISRWVTSSRRSRKAKWQLDHAAQGQPDRL